MPPEYLLMYEIRGAMKRGLTVPLASG